MLSDGALRMLVFGWFKILLLHVCITYQAILFSGLWLWPLDNFLHWLYVVD